MPDDKRDDQYERVMGFHDNPKKYMIIDGVDYSYKAGSDSCYEVRNVGHIVSHAPEFLSSEPDAVKLRKILRKKAERLNVGEWWEWVRETDLLITGNVISAGSWLNILSGISMFLSRYDDYVSENKLWLGKGEGGGDAIKNLINAAASLRIALNSECLPKIPNLYRFLSCGNVMFVSEHHQKLNDFCRENGAKALYNETILDVLSNFELFLEDKRKEHIGTTSKGVRHERQLAKMLLKMLHTDLFREKDRPITLIALIINIRYKKNHTNNKIGKWLSG